MRLRAIITCRVPGDLPDPPLHPAGAQGGTPAPHRCVTPLLVDRGLGEDDLRELAWRFRERVEHGDNECYIWKEQPAARRADFEHWLQGEGEQLEAAFRLKYTQGTSPGQLPFHAHSGVGWKRVSFAWRRKSRADWWERVAVPPTEIPLLTARYRQLVREKRGGSQALSTGGRRERGR